MKFIVIIFLFLFTFIAAMFAYQPEFSPASIASQNCSRGDRIHGFHSNIIMPCSLLPNATVCAYGLSSRSLCYNYKATRFGQKMCDKINVPMNFPGYSQDIAIKQCKSALLFPYTHGDGL
jgi:hypothetical protein